MLFLPNSLSSPASCIEAYLFIVATRFSLLIPVFSASSSIVFASTIIPSFIYFSIALRDSLTAVSKTSQLSSFGCLSIAAETTSLVSSSFTKRFPSSFTSIAPLPRTPSVYIVAVFGFTVGWV